MKKTKKRLIIWACVIVALVVAGIFAYRFAIDFAASKAMNMVISNEIEEMIDSGEMTLEEVESLAEGLLAPTVEAAPEEDGEEESSQKEEKPKQTTAAKPQKKAEVVKKASEKVTGGIPFEDKEAMMRLISSRLTKADIQYLMSLAAGGLEGKELGDAARLAYSRFSASEIEEVKKFWHRYKASVVKKK